MAETCSHLAVIREVTPSGDGCGLFAHWRRMGPSAPVHDVWSRWLLRLFTEPPRNQAFSRQPSSNHQIIPTGRRTGLVLRR